MCIVCRYVHTITQLWRSEDSLRSLIFFYYMSPRDWTSGLAAATFAHRVILPDICVQRKYLSVFFLCVYVCVCVLYMEYVCIVHVHECVTRTMHADTWEWILDSGDFLPCSPAPLPYHWTRSSLFQLTLLATKLTGSSHLSSHLPVLGLVLPFSAILKPGCQEFKLKSSSWGSQLLPPKLSP